MKRMLRSRLLMVFLIICISLSGIFFVRQCLKTAQVAAALVQAAERAQDDQQFIFQLHDQIISMDDSVIVSSGPMNDLEKGWEAFQAELDRLAELEDEIGLRYRDLDGFEAFDTSFSSLIQLGDVILFYAQKGSPAPVDVMLTYFDELENCLNAVGELEGQFSQHMVSSYRLLNRSLAHEKLYLIASALVIILVLTVSVWSLHRAKRSPVSADSTQGVQVEAFSPQVNDKDAEANSAL